ncbi:MAG: DUF2752 domain-containing protein [Verrucomicrobiota bacterium]
MSRRNFRPETIVPPAVTAVVIGILVIVGRFYERLPIKAPQCSFLSLTGYPCVGCGATRSIIAVSKGDWLKALQFNPLIFLGLISVGIWLVFALVRTFRKSTTPEQTGASSGTRSLKLSTRSVVAIVVLLILANWIYLLIYLPR